MTKNEIEREIEKLIDAGYRVLPLRPNEKRPACENGVKDATNDKNEATRLFTNVDALNVGVACFNLFVLDVDVKNGKNGLDDLREMEATLGELRPRLASKRLPAGGVTILRNRPNALRRRRKSNLPGAKRISIFERATVTFSRRRPKSTARNTNASAR